MRIANMLEDDDIEELNTALNILDDVIRDCDPLNKGVCKFAEQNQEKIKRAIRIIEGVVADC